MKLGTKGRYTMIALTDLALQGEQTVVTLSALSKRQNISVTYLEQLFVKLRRAGFVESVRGPGGGYRLRQSAEAIRVVDVLRAVDENTTITWLPKKTQGAHKKPNKALCGTRAQAMNNRLWEAFNASVYVFLHNITLSDLVANRLTPCQAVPYMVLTLADDEPHALV